MLFLWPFEAPAPIYVTSPAPDAPGCSLNGVTEADYGQFRTCVSSHASLSQECKEYYWLAAGLDCIEQTGAEFCAAAFMAGRPGLPTSNIQQLFDNLSSCSIDQDEWQGASEERVTELLRQFAQCIKPAVEQFKSQHSC